MLDQVGIAWIAERGGELLGESDAIVELLQGQQAGVGRERGFHLDLDVQRFVEIQVEEGSRRRYIHGGPPGYKSGPVVQPLRRRPSRFLSNPVNAPGQKAESRR